MTAVLQRGPAFRGLSWPGHSAIHALRRKARSRLPTGTPRTLQLHVIHARADRRPAPPTLGQPRGSRLPRRHRRPAGGPRVPQRAPDLRPGGQPLVPPRLGAARALLRRTHGRRADRTARGMAHGSVRARRAGRHALRARLGRHEKRPRGNGCRDRAVRCTSPEPRGQPRLPDHQRRGRPFGGRHPARDAGARGPRREDRLLRRRRAHEPRAPRRYDQDRPPRVAVGQAHGARRAGAHRLPSPRRQPRARLRARARGTRRAALGRGQRVFPADFLPGLERRGRHGRAERDTGRDEGAIQPALLDGADGRVAAAHRARDPRPPRRQVHAGMVRLGPAVFHFARPADRSRVRRGAAT